MIPLGLLLEAHENLTDSAVHAEWREQAPGIEKYWTPREERGKRWKDPKLSRQWHTEYERKRRKGTQHVLPDSEAKLHFLLNNIARYILEPVDGKRPDAETLLRLVSKIEKVPPPAASRLTRPSPCWLFKAGHDRKGYAQIRFHGPKVRVHRLTYELMRGKIGEGLQVDHLCERPACCNPDHISPATQYQNLAASPNSVIGKQVCSKGHPLDIGSDNVRIGKGKHKRVCRTCNREASQRIKAGWSEERLEYHRTWSRDYQRARYQKQKTEREAMNGAA
ncbi:MAG: HNH endonuclease signature motif containing protein [Rhodomicrobium sp.]